MRGTEQRVWHNVPKNETTRLPRRYIFLDSEARIRRVHKGAIQTWRLAVASYCTAPKGRDIKSTMVDYTDPKTLWGDVESFCAKGARTVLWAHNLGYDVRITQMFDMLPALGWRLTAHNIGKSGVWLEWKKDGKTLLMADSLTVYGQPLVKVGALFGMGKIEVPKGCNDDEIWLQRCRQDVRILQTAMLNYLRWIEDDDLGNWRLTGAAQSWATYRHKFLTHKLVVHDDEEALTAERRAMWAGRCEAYWHGEIRGQVVHEWDFTQAYARIARDNVVPVRLLGPMPRDYDWRRVVDSSKSALLAEVRVSTEVPVVPCESGGRILWPVGEFTTTLWDVEIKAALDAGARVEVIRGWLYHMEPALRAWGEWIIGQLDAPDDEVPTWKKLILKHQSRALIGYMAMTHNTWEEFATVEESRVQRSTFIDLDKGTACDMMQVGRDVWIDNGRVESPNSMPMITGYVQAIARVDLWNILKELPKGAALYVDTDSLLCADSNSAVVASVARKLGYDGFRLKRSWDGFTIRGPRQLVTGTLVRVSGVPRNAHQISKTELIGEVWDSLPGSIRRGDTGSVVIRNRKWRIPGVDNRRTSNGFGWTAPIEIGAE